MGALYGKSTSLLKIESAVLCTRTFYVISFCGYELSKWIVEDFTVIETVSSESYTFMPGPCLSARAAVLG